jgi:hypothetical protein
MIHPSLTSFVMDRMPHAQPEYHRLLSFDTSMGKVTAISGTDNPA